MALEKRRQNLQQRRLHMQYAIIVRRRYTVNAISARRFAPCHSSPSFSESVSSGIFDGP